MMGSPVRIILAGRYMQKLRHGYFRYVTPLIVCMRSPWMLKEVVSEFRIDNASSVVLVCHVVMSDDVGRSRHLKKTEKSSEPPLHRPAEYCLC